MKVIIRVACAIVLAGIVLTGCGSASTGAGGTASAKKICVVHQELQAEGSIVGNNIMAQVIKSHGYEMVERNAHSDANQQLQQVKDCISQRVAGIVIFAVDGDSVITVIGEANKANIPIGLFNRPPSAGNTNPALVVVANNQEIAVGANEYMVQQAQKLHRKVHPLIMVGNLGDPNAVERKKGFDAVIAKYPDVFNKPVYVDTKWDAAVGLAGLQNAMQANPDIDYIFTSSDFLYPQIKAVLNPLGKWKPVGDPKHVILGGVDGDSRACNWTGQGYVDATGVQDLSNEAKVITEAVFKAIDAKEGKPNQTLIDHGFTLTHDNFKEKGKDMWGCQVSPLQN